MPKLQLKTQITLKPKTSFLFKGLEKVNTIDKQMAYYAAVRGVDINRVREVSAHSGSWSLEFSEKHLSRLEKEIKERCKKGPFGSRFLSSVYINPEFWPLVAEMGIEEIRELREFLRAKNNVFEGTTESCSLPLATWSRYLEEFSSIPCVILTHA